MVSNDNKVPSPYRVLTDEVPREDVAAAMGSLIDDDSIHLRDYWRVLLRYRRLILAVFGFCVISTAVVTFTMRPVYTATSSVEIERQSPKVAPVHEVQSTDPATDVWDQHDYYQTQYEILRSRTLTVNVIRALGLDNDERFTMERGLLGFFEALRSRFESWFGKPETESDESFGING